MDKLIILETIEEEREFLKLVLGTCVLPDSRVKYLQSLVKELDGFNVYKMVKYTPNLFSKVRYILPKHDLKIYLL